MTQDELNLQFLVNEVVGAHAVGPFGVRLTWDELMALALRIQQNVTKEQTK